MTFGGFSVPSWNSSGVLERDAASVMSSYIPHDSGTYHSISKTY